MIHKIDFERQLQTRESNRNLQREQSFFWYSACIIFIIHILWRDGGQGNGRELM